MGLSLEQFAVLIDEIKQLGYDEETSAQFAALIGDTPCFDEQGRVVVIDHGHCSQELARLCLKSFGEE